MHYDLGPANRHAKWCFSRLRFMSSIVKDRLRKDALWEDLIQELYVAGYCAWQQDLNIRETRNYAGRRIRAFFKENAYMQYRYTYVKRETPFSIALADWQEEELEEAGITVDRFFREDPAADHYLQERILNMLKQRQEGMTRTTLTHCLQVSVQECQRYLDNLAKAMRVIVVQTESCNGHPTPPLYFAAGVPIPEQKKVRTEMYERIRHAYFIEGKTKMWIVDEYHHDFRTVCKALGSAPVPQVNPEEKELVLV